MTGPRQLFRKQKKNNDGKKREKKLGKQTRNTTTGHAWHAGLRGKERRKGSKSERFLNSLAPG